MTKSLTIQSWALSKVGCPYIFAANGQKCTPSYRQKQMAAKPTYAANIKKYCPVLSGKKTDCSGCSYKDKPSYDCSGLTKEAAKLVGITLPHGASGQWKGDYWDVKGPIDQMPMDKVCFVFNDSPDADPMGHVGIYLGNRFVVDARGHAQGVMYKPLDSYPWDHYAILKGMLEEVMSDMPDPVEVTTRDTVRMGAKCGTVTELQGLLMKHGITVDGAQIKTDGIFGPITDAAVRQFQAAKGLVVDGVVGPLTWAALLSSITTTPQANPADKYTFMVSGITAAQAMVECDRLRAVYGACEMAVG